MATNCAVWARQIETGGYDHDFYDEVPERLTCLICAKPFRDPHLAVCCGKHFCESCLTASLNSGWTIASCPHCRSIWNESSSVLHKGVRSEVLELKIYCSNNLNGCPWVGQLGHLRCHLTSQQGCGYELIPCPNMCRETSRHTTICTWGVQPKVKCVYRKDLAHHLTNECVNRMGNCQYCHKMGTYQEIVEFHHGECPEYPISCPNVQCNVTNIKRKELNDHLKVCPEQLVECSFAEAGCHASIRRRQLHDHMSSYMQEHLTILMEAYQDVKRRLENLEGQQNPRARPTW